MNKQSLAVVLLVVAIVLSVATVFVVLGTDVSTGFFNNFVFRDDRPYVAGDNQGGGRIELSVQNPPDA